MIKNGLNSFQLKCIAIITMLIDHIGTVILALVYIPFVVDNVIDLTGLESNVILAFYLRKPCWIIGRIAFPIFCFLLVEGFIHTKNINKYITRLFVFSIISEIPHDLAFYDSIIEFSLQNVMFTLLIGLLTLCIIKKVENKYSKRNCRKLCFICLAIIVGTIISMVLKVEYAEVAVLAISLMYLFRELKTLRIIGGALPLVTTTWWVLPALIPIALYNGEQGRKMKYFFYWFYPIHLLVLYLVASFIGI